MREARLRRPARVALSALVAGHRGGVGRYAAELCRGLAAQARADADLELVALLSEPAAEAVGEIECETRIVARHAPKRGGSMTRIATEQAAQIGGGYDLVHFFDLVGPVLRPNQRFTATAHDTKFVDEPEAFSRSQRVYKLAISRFAVRRAAEVVAVSHDSKTRVVDRLGARAAKVHVIHSGPGFPARAIGTAEGGTPYFLVVGELVASKNIPFLIRAFGLADVDARLILAGRPGPGYEDIVHAIAESPVGNRIETRTRADDAEIDGLYRGALALLSSSRYEGFGFTPLEAMSRGCTVIASQLPVTTEILADGALLLPLDEPAQWVDAIRRAAVDEDWRGRQAGRGRGRAAAFSWDQTALRVLGVLRGALAL